MRRRKAQIIHSPDVTVVAVPYHGGFVAEFKARIPPSHRRWEPKTRVWLVSPERGEEAAEVARHHFRIVEENRVEETPAVFFTNGYGEIVAFITRSGNYYEGVGLSAKVVREIEEILEKGGF